MDFLHIRYRPVRVTRQLQSFLITVVLAGLTGGCAVSTGFLDNKVDEIVTGSVGKSTKPDNVDLADWVSMRTALNEATRDTIAGSPVPWENESTGSSGSLMAFSAPSDGDGRCKNFAATLQNIDGVHRYKGEACTAGRDNWQISRFELIDLTP